MAKAGWSGEATALDETYVKAQRAARSGKEGPRRAIGPSQAGPTTKINVLIDVIGHPRVIHFTPSNVSNVKTDAAVLANSLGGVCQLIVDNFYDADLLRQDSRQEDISVIIPSTRARKRKIRSTGGTIVTAGGSRRCFAALKTPAASPLAIPQLRISSRPGCRYRLQVLINS